MPSLQVSALLTATAIATAAVLQGYKSVFASVCLVMCAFYVLCVCLIVLSISQVQPAEYMVFFSSRVYKSNSKRRAHMSKCHADIIVPPPLKSKDIDPSLFSSVSI